MASATTRPFVSYQIEGNTRPDATAIQRRTSFGATHPRNSSCGCSSFSFLSNGPSPRMTAFLPIIATASAKIEAPFSGDSRPTKSSGPAGSPTGSFKAAKLNGFCRTLTGRPTGIFPRSFSRAKFETARNPDVRFAAQATYSCTSPRPILQSFCPRERGSQSQLMQSQDSGARRQILRVGYSRNPPFGQLRK